MSIINGTILAAGLSIAAGGVPAHRIDGTYMLAGLGPAPLYEPTIIQLNADGTIPIPTSESDVITVTAQPYNAVGNGTTDDTAAFLAAIAAAKARGGGVISSGGGYIFKTTQKLLIDSSNITMDLGGSEILFQPTDTVTHDRAIVVHANDTGGFSGLRVITGAIAAGATSFVAAAAGSVSDLVAGDWLFIQETDAGVGGEIVICDWVQVASVAGTTVNTYTKFRTAFPGTHSTVNFRRIVNVVQNTTIRNLRIRTTDTVNALLGVSVGIARNTLIDHITSKPAKGNAIFSYRSAGLKVRGCFIERDMGQANEFAATVDLQLQGNTFGTVDITPDTAALTLDFGTAFFNVIGNDLSTAANIGLQVLYGCHDGAITSNTISMIVGTGSGVSCLGMQRVTLSHNIVTGPGSGTGIGLADATAPNPDIISTDNVVVFNIVTGFAVQYATTALDVFIQANWDGTANPGSLTVGTLNQHLAANVNVRSRLISGVAQILGINDAGNAYTQLRIDGNDLLLNFNSLGKVGIGVAPSSLLTLTTAGVFGWDTGASATDTALSRISAGVLGVGTGAAGSFAGTLKATTINAVTAIQLNGTSINTGGTLTNVAYLDQANSFSANQTLGSANVLKWSTDNGISRLGAASLAIGNGPAGDFTGSLKLSLISNAVGSAGAPSYTFSSDLTSGIFSGGTGVVNFTAASTTRMLYTANYLGVQAAFSIAWSQSSNAADTVDVILARLGAASLRLGGGNSATPASYTLTGGESSRGGTDSNVAGGSLTIRSGLGTGTGAVTSIAFQTATVAASGTTAQTYATRLTIGTILAFQGEITASPTVGGTIGLDIYGGVLTLASTGILSWNASGVTPGTGSPDLVLARDAANTLALRNGVNAQAFNIYNTYTDASNYERCAFFWSANECYILSTNAGTGTIRPLHLRTSGLAALSFDTNNTSRWLVQSNGHLLGVTDNTYDIGAAGATRPRSVYIGTDIFTGSTAFMHRTSGTLANGAAAAAGTLTNAPAAGNPTKWIPIDDNGTTRYIPAW